MPHRGRLLVSLETRKSFLVLFFKKEQKKNFFLKKEAKTFCRLGVCGLASAKPHATHKPVSKVHMPGSKPTQ